jgi:uncharacterized protein (DUF1684 family)
MAASDHLDLWDYRRRVADQYWAVRRRGPGEPAWRAWREARDELFREHPQSALDETTRGGFGGLRYFAYDPIMRFEVFVHPFDEGGRTLIGHSGSEETAFRRFGQAEIEIAGTITNLVFYWLEGYGGGVFVPFGDLTNGNETYGGGRYLLDSAKGADLGTNDEMVVVDFNYAYHPSCVHSDRWSCPLAPSENRLPVAVRAGERL